MMNKETKRQMFLLFTDLIAVIGVFIMLVSSTVVGILIASNLSLI